MKKTAKAYKETLEKIRADISTSGKYTVRNEKGKSREMDAALSIVESLDNL